MLVEPQYVSIHQSIYHPVMRKYPLHTQVNIHTVLFFISLLIQAEQRFNIRTVMHAGRTNLYQTLTRKPRERLGRAQGQNKAEKNNPRP